MRLAEHLRPGLILNMSTRTVMGGLIRRALRFGWDGRLSDIPNHDAIVVRHYGKTYIGESKPPFAGLTPIEDYERMVESGEVYNLRIMAVAGAHEEQELLASAWWLSNVNRKPYDWMAFPRLLWKATMADWCPRAAGWEWAWDCTEGVRDAYKIGAGVDPWGKNNPTPLTTFKRALERKLIVLRHIGESVTRKGGTL